MDNDRPEFVIQNGIRGLFFRGRFLYFSDTISSALIFLRRLKKNVDRIINIIFSIFGISGLGALAYWIFSHIKSLSISWRLIFFWENRHYLILWFLLSLIADLFLVYRSGRARAAAVKIKKFKGHNDRLPAAEFYLPKPKARFNKINTAAAFSPECRRAFDNAYLAAVKLEQSQVGVIHLFWALLKNDQIAALLSRLNIDLVKLVELLKRHIASGEESKKSPSWSSEVEEVALLAFVDSYHCGQKSIDPLNLILFCYERHQILQEILYELEIDNSKIVNAVEWFRINRRLYENYQAYRRLARLKPGGAMNRAYTAVATPTLDYFSRDLTAQSKYGSLEICVGREKEIEAIFQAWESGQAGVLLVGGVGVGKATIIEGLAQLMVREEVPAFLKDKRLVEIDLSRLIAGAGPSESQARLLSIIDETRRARNIVLVIQNLENLMGISGGGDESLDLSEVLANALRHQQVYCLASVTSEDYSRYLENQSLGHVMTTVGVQEPNFNSAIQILESKVSYLENQYKVYFDYSSLEQLVKLTSRYLNDKLLPEKAINLLRQVAVKVSQRPHPEERFCTKDDVASAISELTGIPLNKISESETHKLLDLEKNIHQRMIGQEEAVSAIAGSLRRARAELREGKRPIASFLFLGPTGVGKTELAKSVAEVYFGNEDYMIRLDMSEYQLPESVDKMIGNQDGVLGYLTEAVRKKPFSLVLLDEVEKAHPDILNLFLQMMDDGRLTDGQGRTINFTNSIIVATSNAGAMYIQDAVKSGVDSSIIKQELIDNQLTKFMRPELINRFDGVIVFKPLELEQVFQIAKLLIKKIARSLEEKGIELEVDEEGVKKLALAGYDPKFGARPLRRLLQERIENEIANLLLSNKLARRDTVFINADGLVESRKAEAL